MTKFLRTDWPFIILLAILSIFSIWGISSVPFHPDEATQLYMSSDVETGFTNPTALFWESTPDDAQRQIYRELDAPLTKYLLGFGRILTGQKAPALDWDWNQSWDENLQGGAYPNPETLFVGRLAITLLLPLSLTLMYFIGKQIHSRKLGWLAMFFLGTQAVVLLHSRRAMAEGTLLFGVIFATWGLLQLPKRPWLAGFGLAIAFNAKQSALALVPVGIIAILWAANQNNLHQKKPKKIFWLEYFKKITLDLLITAIAFIGISFLLNPIHWRSPRLSIESAIQARANLLENQIEDLIAIAPEKYLATPSQRITMLIANVFIGPAEHSLVGNLSATREAVNDYIALPGHNLFRGLIWGVIFLILTVVGFSVAARDVFFKKPPNRFKLGILLLATLFQGAGLIIAIPLPWVRFTIPIIPYFCFWMAYGLSRFSENIIAAKGRYK